MLLCKKMVFYPTKYTWAFLSVKVSLISNKSPSFIINDSLYTIYSLQLTEPFPLAPSYMALWYSWLDTRYVARSPRWRTVEQQKFYNCCWCSESSSSKSYWTRHCSPSPSCWGSSLTWAGARTRRTYWGSWRRSSGQLTLWAVPGSFLKTN